MDKRLLQAFLSQIVSQGGFALLAFVELKAAADQGRTTHALYAAQNLLVCAVGVGEFGATNQITGCVSA